MFGCLVRQLGLDADSPIAKTVSKAAEGYLRDDSRKVTSESKQIACELVSGPMQGNDVLEVMQKDICQDMLLELEIFVVAYFSFHWQHAPSIIEKVSATCLILVSPSSSSTFGN